LTNSLRFLGIAKKAGALEIGEECVRAAILSGKAKIILTAEDLSENSKKKIEHIAEEKAVPIVELKEKKIELGEAFGRGTPGIIAVTDLNFASGYMLKLNEENFGIYTEVAELLKERAEKNSKADTDSKRVSKRRMK